MRCQNCSKEIDETDMYCRYCGKALHSHFHTKPYSLLALILISGLLSLYVLALFIRFTYTFNSFEVNVCCFVIASIALALSIIGIVHSATSKRNVGHFYDLARGIVACSLSGCMILYEIIRLIIVLS